MNSLRPPAARSNDSAVPGMLWNAVWRFRGRVLSAMVLLVIAKLATVAVPLALKRIVDELSHPQTMLVLPVLLLLTYALLRFAGTFFGELRDTVFARVTQHTVAEFTLRTFVHLHGLGSRFHSRRRTGALTRDVERGTGGIAFLLGAGLFTIVPTIVEIGSVGLIMGLNYNLWFTTIIAVTFLAYTGFTLVFTERRAIHQRALNELDSRANSRLVDSLLNYETVKYFSNEALERQHLRQILRESIRVGLRNQRALSLLHIGQSGIIAVGVAAVMLLVAANVVDGTMTVGDLVLINAYVIQICLPLNALGFVFRQAKDALINAEKMMALLRQVPDVRDPPDAPVLAVRNSEVRFEHVNFGYEPSRQILWDVDFTIPRGRTVAIVGGSGSGKSTLARLLFRFYDVGGGRISIDGRDIREVTQKSLRDAIGIVPQDTVLFNESIAYNISYGRAKSSFEEVVEAAKAAHVHDFITSLPEEYDTIVGERGVSLSGGEKQRIAIARAILKNPPVLICDEATSALDLKSERAIQSELDRVAQDRTTLVIAHRLSTVVNADEILVLDRGRIVERGTHDALLAHHGLYAQMWSLQQQEREMVRTERRLSMQPVNLVALIAGLLDAMRPAIDAKGLRLYMPLQSESATVTADPSTLQQSIWDLLSTAVELTPDGGRVELRLERAGPNVRLVIMDASTTAPTAGAMLSDVEALVRSSIEHQRGAFAMDRAADDSGNVYTVEFPLRAVSGFGHPRQRTEDRDAESRSIEGTQIMIIDDQRDARELLGETLQQRGARVESFASGSEGLARGTAGERVAGHIDLRRSDAR